MTHDDYTVVLVNVGRGWVASLRFSNQPENDCELSSVSKVLLYGYVERKLRELGYIFV